MKKILFLIPEARLKPSSLFGAIEIFEHANNFFINKGKAPYYDIKIIGAGLQQSIMNSQLVIKSGTDALKGERPDVIIIPGLYENNNFLSAANKVFLEWMVDQYKEGCQLASLCTGAFMLAATGLLANKECSTHWAAEKSFQEMFPNVKLCTSKIVTNN